MDLKDDITLEDGIPIPPIDYNNRGKHWRGSAETPFSRAMRTMEVGQSFCIRKDKTSLSGSTQRFKRQLGRHYTIRKVDDEGTYRIWRTK